MRKPRPMDVPLDSLHAESGRTADTVWSPSDRWLSVATRLGPDAVLQLLRCHPVVIQERRDETYVVVAAVRSLHLARAALPLDADVPALLFADDFDDLFASILDDLVAPLLLAESDEQSLLRWTDARDAGALTPSMASRFGFRRGQTPTLGDIAGYLGVSRGKLERAVARGRGKQG